MIPKTPHHLKTFSLFILVLLLFNTITLFAQTELKTNDTIKKELPQPKFVFKGLFQARYLTGMSDDVDINGLHHSDQDAVNNSFDVKRARIQVKAIISDRTEVALLMNLADFKSDPKNKVLENAYLTYILNPYIKITAGQFRPTFGLENTYPIDIIKSMDFSNQYYEFGNNGWESFQIGVGISGKVKLKEMPFSYALTVFNGNGRNQNADKDNGKQYTGRFVFGLTQKNKINLGLNGGVGEVFDKKVYAVGIDATAEFKLQDNLFLEMQVEAKQATNHNMYFKMEPIDRLPQISKYQMRGFYVLPNLRYEIKSHRLTSVEFSCRYENFDTNYRLESNVRQTWLPMLNFEFLKDYNARIQLGVQIDQYERNIVNTTTYNNKLFILQVQTRL
ncbi:porin [Flavobacterium sp. '19STA2R22 D10 B1']|uniref:porin n=1 Tax=Flavobacterium aerium TaxID=3037261 RepID=UPI00278C54C1|nr:porin [Flavobacterium sp. '19STA2R22 D10 B1']